MADDVILPSLGQTTNELTIVVWYKNDGDKVRKGDVLLEVETDKAVVPVEAYVDGILKDIRFEEGALVEVGSVLAVIMSADEVANYSSVKPASEQTAVEPTENEIAEQSKVAPSSASTYILASPQAKQMARDHGIELSKVPISRVDGIIKAQDIENHLQKQPLAKPSLMTNSHVDVVVIESGSKHKLSKMRKAIADRLSYSKQTIPHYYLTVHVDASDLVRLREDLKRQMQVDISYNSFIFRASALALKKYPALNSSLVEDYIITHPEAHIGLAVEVEDGLRVPVIRNVDSHSIWELTTLLKETVERAKQGKSSALEASGGTFTISSLGSSGVDEFAAIINPPEAAILAVGRIAKRAFVYEDEVKSGMGLSLTLSVDHRIVDGAEAGRFLQAIRDELEHPLRLLVATDVRANGSMK